MPKKTTFAVVAKIRGLLEKADKLRQRLLELVGLTQNESGCLSCEIVENACDSTEFTLIQEWLDEQAHTAHLGANSTRYASKLISILLSGELDRRKHVLRPNSVRYGTNSYCAVIN